MKPDWLMDQFSALVPNGTQGSGIHFQHPDQPLSATTLPQTHPLKTRIATLLQALHFMRDWQVSPFCRVFRRLSFPFLASQDLDSQDGQTQTPNYKLAGLNRLTAHALTDLQRGLTNHVR